MLTLKELSGQTGLTENSIRKFLRLFGAFLKPYIKRGVSNKLLFDPNCVVIFSEVKRLRDEGKIAKEIIAALKKAPPSSSEPSGHELIYQKIRAEQTDKTGQSDVYKRNLHELYQKLLEEKEKRIQERDERDTRIVRLEIQNVKMQEAMKLLPDGKKPAQIRKEWNLARKKAQAAAGIIADIKRLSFFRFLKRKKHLDKLQELLV
jgi:hypothetical protein